MFPFTFCSFSPQLRLKAKPPECGLTEVNLSHFRLLSVQSDLHPRTHTLLSRGEETAGLQHTTVRHVAQYQQTPAHLLGVHRCFGGHLTEKGTLMLDNQGHSLVLAVAGITQLTLSFWPRFFRHRPKCSRIAQRFCQGTESIGVKPNGPQNRENNLCQRLTPNVSQSCRGHCELAPLPRLTSAPLTEMKTHRRNNNWLGTARSFFFACACLPACSYPQPAAGSAALASLNRHSPSCIYLCPPAS
ncbi:hypothetical protein Pelo_18705 [Pelomyxa schiedti]|nr:hypothetical protein Pelo_18705 [Pelomyxa schiedti]